MFGFVKRYHIAKLLVLAAIAVLCLPGCRTVERTVNGRVMAEGSGVAGARVWRETGECDAGPDDAAVTDEEGRFAFVVRDWVNPVFIRAFSEAWFLDGYCFGVDGVSYGPVMVQVWDGSPGSLVDCELSEVDGRPACE